MNTLRLIKSEQNGDLLNQREAPKEAADPVQRLFDHWVFMLGKNPKRCALGPTRRKVIAAALALYDEETLELAIEGCAASAFHAGENDRGKAYDDLELIFRNEAKVETFAADGEKLRDRAAAEMRPATPLPEIGPRETPEQVALRKQTLAALAARISGRG